MWVKLRMRVSNRYMYVSGWTEVSGKGREVSGR